MLPGLHYVPMNLLRRFTNSPRALIGSYLLREIRAVVESLRRDGGDGLVAQLDKVEARVDYDLRG